MKAYDLDLANLDRHIQDLDTEGAEDEEDPCNGCECVTCVFAVPPREPL